MERGNKYEVTLLKYSLYLVCSLVNHQLLNFGWVWLRVFVHAYVKMEEEVV